MIQEIAPDRFYNEYMEQRPGPEDYILRFCENQIQISRKEFEKDDTIFFPNASDRESGGALQYLFRINENRYFLDMQYVAAKAKEGTCDENAGAGFLWIPVRRMRYVQQKTACMAAMTGYHLFRWYRDNRFCGRCGQKLVPDFRERMLYCPHCENQIFPKIAPAVIVGLVDSKTERILMTKYADRDYKRYALIAGFTEIGETAEETVMREVMEEVGLKVKNITYYKSQPWGFDSNLLLGFFAELDGDDTITREEQELAVAEWIPRAAMADRNDGISLTREMMEQFYLKGKRLFC